MKTKRREFIKTSATAIAGASVMTPNVIFGKDDRKVRMAFIGLGGRGRWHMKLCLQREDVEVKAICDIDPKAIAASEKMLKTAGYKNVPAYTDGEEAYLKLLEQGDIDGVIIATPWVWHTKMACAAMRAGIYAGVEVSAANTLEECWDLVNTFEETGTPCMILENVNYRRDVMAVLNMVRQGLFGELIHMECGYQHNLQKVKFNPGVEFGPGAHGEARWRTRHSILRNGDVYPTHGLGPVSSMLDINFGNRLLYLTSTASKARGLHDYIVKTAGKDHPNAKIKFKLGDVITTVIKTANDETITVQHDTNLPRPYSLGFRVQGTEGLWMDVNKSIYLDGKSPDHSWEPAAPYLEKYDHPLWKRYARQAEGGGHGGMDFFVDHAFVESIKRKVNTPLDAYDAAAWSSIAPLSEMSIAHGSEPVDIPDFTRGMWMKRKPKFALTDEY
ncbi:MAG: Gfo/Idh/MocA family oxidoreductase [Cytophagales bacterium]|nr:Gfo/Idh/MocA family oxidoreductase [Cytophagales bacterium]